MIIGKIGGFRALVTFDFQNGTFFPRGLTRSIANVQTDVHEYSDKNYFGIPDHQKVHGLAPENRQNWRFSCSGSHLTFKMGRFGRVG